MFDMYENTIKKYKFTTTTGIKQELTENDLYELMMLDIHHVNIGVFTDVIRKLDLGFNIEEDYYEFDWVLGTPVRKGRFTLSKLKQKLTTEPPPIPKNSGCDHKGKYVNEAGGVRFFVCPKCKADLGDA